MAQGRGGAKGSSRDAHLVVKARRDRAVEPSDRDRSDAKALDGRRCGADAEVAAVDREAHVGCATDRESGKQQDGRRQQRTATRCTGRREAKLSPVQRNVAELTTAEASDRAAWRAERQEDSPTVGMLPCPGLTLVDRNGTLYVNVAAASQTQTKPITMSTSQRERD